MSLLSAYGSINSQPQMNGKLKATTLTAEEIRYTGKPYNADLGAFVFNYRDYDPRINRWTSADPSGFPDGANNQCYGPVPTHCIDSAGLDTTINPKITFNDPFTNGNLFAIPITFQNILYINNGSPALFNTLPTPGGLTSTGVNVTVFGQSIAISLSLEDGNQSGAPHQAITNQVQTTIPHPGWNVTTTTTATMDMSGTFTFNSNGGITIQQLSAEFQKVGITLDTSKFQATGTVTFMYKITGQPAQETDFVE
jgi:RHS repeat-associated protein